MKQRLLSLSVLTLLFLLYVVSPWVTRPRHGPAYEMAAIRSLSTLNTAQNQYQPNYGRFAESLQELGPPAGDAKPTPGSADLIPPNLASGSASGYVFLMIPRTEGYQILAWPQFDQNGERSFFTDETTTIRANKGRPAWVTDPPIR